MTTISARSDCFDLLDVTARLTRLYFTMCVQLPDLGALSRLQKLDLSHNQLRQTTQLSSLPAVKLQELYLTSNKLSTIQVGTLHACCLELCCSLVRVISPCLLHLALLATQALQGLDQMTALTLLELGDNRIQHVEGLDHLSSLRQLWLGRNRITTISGLDR